MNRLQNPNESTQTKNNMQNKAENKDPKGEAGKLKTPLQLLPPEPMRACAEVLKLGAEKYGAWNWRTSDGVETMTYVGAIRRHLDAFVEGEELDPESGESHLAHILAGAMILMDAKHVDQLIDNRPPCGNKLDGEKIKKAIVGSLLMPEIHFIGGHPFFLVGDVSGSHTSKTPSLQNIPKSESDIKSPDGMTQRKQGLVEEGDKILVKPLDGGVKPYSPNLTWVDATDEYGVGDEVECYLHVARYVAPEEVFGH